MHTDTNASIKYLHEYHEYKCERNANLKNTCLYVCYQKRTLKTVVYMQNNCAVDDREYDWLGDTKVQTKLNCWRHSLGSLSLPNSMHILKWGGGGGGAGVVISDLKISLP